MKQKYHAFIAPYVPSDFTLEYSQFDYQLIDAGTRLTETYKVDKTKSEAFAQVKSLFEKQGLEVEDRSQSEYDPIYTNNYTHI